MATELTAADARRPGALDFLAGLLLLATVVLHVVAMVPVYFVVSGSLMSQPDQAALYAILAAAWALALGVGLTGPHRTPVAGALAVGVAVTELGFRVADLGDAIRFGASSVGTGLWLMEAAWVVGAAAAGVAVVAAISRHGRRSADDAPVPSEWNVDWTAPVSTASSADRPEPNPYADAAEAAHGAPDAVSAPITEGLATDDPTVSLKTPDSGDPTTDMPAPAGGDTSILPPIPDAAVGHPIPATDEDPHERLAWTLLVATLAAVVAGAFLPAWDHAVAVSTQTGQTVTRSLGNAFTGPWQQIVGTVLAAVAMLAVPVVAIRMRSRAVGAAAVVGSLLVVTTQLVSAVVQVDQPLPPGDFGISPAQAHALSLSLSLKLTGWFTVDALAAYALFAAIMVWATLRPVQENSPGTRPSAPEWRSEAMPSAS